MSAPRFLGPLLALALALVGSACGKSYTQKEACAAVGKISCERLAQCDLLTSTPFQGYSGTSLTECLAKVQMNCDSSLPPCKFEEDAVDDCTGKIAMISCNQIGTAIGSCQKCR